MQQIEVKMEEFKVCEKDLKTKAYSREGLSREEKLDPHELLKEEKRAWIQGVIEAIESAVEIMEADLEKFSSSKPKSKYKEKVTLPFPPRPLTENLTRNPSSFLQIEKLGTRIVTSKWHISKLEQINRLLDNDSLEPTQLDDLKDDIDLLVEVSAIPCLILIPFYHYILGFVIYVYCLFMLYVRAVLALS